MTTGEGLGADELETVACCVCGPSPVRVWLDEGRGTRYVRCRACRTVFASPRQSRSVRERWLSAAFGVNDAALENATRRAPALAAEAAIIRRHVPEGRLLDVGCDVGALFEWFPGASWERHGVELVAAAAEYAARTQGVAVHAGTMASARYPPGSFDVVTMLDVLYHLEDPRADLARARRVLRPGGLLAVEIAGQRWTFLRSRGPACLLLDGRWTRLQSDSAHLYWFSPGALRRLLGATGFEVVATHVVPSPTALRAWQRVLVAAHARLAGALVRALPPLLTLAPKYLVLARAPA